MTMWNEADEWDYQTTQFGAAPKRSFNRHNLPIDNPRSYDHDVYQTSVNRFAGLFVVLLTLVQITLTESWLDVMFLGFKLLVTALFGGAAYGLLVWAVIGLWPWLKGES